MQQVLADNGFRPRRPSRSEIAGIGSNPQHVGHLVKPGFLSDQEVDGGDGAFDVRVATVAAVDEFHGLAQGGEDDRVLTDVVAGADGVQADFAGRPGAGNPLPTVATLGRAQFLFDDLGELERRAAGASA